jgi:hypothetical protein
MGAAMAEDDSTTTNPRNRFFELASIATAAEPPRPEQLGLWPDDRRGVPNVVLRSALFSAGKPTRVRKSYRDHELQAAIGTKSISYTGQQLYQHELDVWLEVLHRCRLRPAGVETDFHVHGFLKSLRRSTGNKDHKQLHATLGLLHATSIKVVVDRDERGRSTGYRGHLIEKFRFNDQLLRWEVGVNSDIAELFAPKDHTWLHIDARLDLGKNYLAKWLHGYFSSHRKPYPVGVSRLRELSGSATSRLRRFREALSDALNEVAMVEKKHKRRFEWRLDDEDLVHVVRHSDN